jgi:hypothetical protein
MPVVIPFNFTRAAQGKKQRAGINLPELEWNDDVPRKLFSEDGYVLVSSWPKFTDEAGTVSDYRYDC